MAVPPSQLIGDSVYLFLGSFKILPTIIGASALLLQIILYIVIYRAARPGGSDYSEGWEIGGCKETNTTLTAPTCEKLPGLSTKAWIGCIIIALSFVGKDIVGGIRLCTLTCQTLKPKYALVGFVQLLTSLGGFLLIGHFILGTAEKDVKALLDTTVLFFINEIDEGWFSLVKRINSEWVDGLADQFNGFQAEAARNQLELVKANDDDGYESGADASSGNAAGDFSIPCLRCGH